MTASRVWKFGADVDTDVLAPGAYMKNGIEVIAQHCLEALRPDLLAPFKRAMYWWLATTLASDPRVNKRRGHWFTSACEP
jgi:hypothetical protein